MRLIGLVRKEGVGAHATRHACKRLLDDKSEEDVEFVWRRKDASASIPLVARTTSFSRIASVGVSVIRWRSAAAARRSVSVGPPPSPAYIGDAALQWCKMALRSAHEWSDVRLDGELHGTFEELGGMGSIVSIE